MTSKELLIEIESWLSFNTEPSREETAKLRKSIKDHLTEQLRIHDVVGSALSSQYCKDCKNYLEPKNLTYENHLKCKHCVFIGNQQSNFEPKSV